MKPIKTKGILPLSFVDDKLQHPLHDAEDLMARLIQHVNEQLSELKMATKKHELPSIKPLAESLQNGMNILDFHKADDTLLKIQEKAAKLQDDQELGDFIEKVCLIWENEKP